MFHTIIMQEPSENIQYNTKGIPFYIKEDHLSQYPDYRGFCHWHDDVEWIRIKKGSMFYYVNGKEISLQEGDCLMVNSRKMHYGYSSSHEECDFNCIIIHPQLFTANKVMYLKCISPVIENENLEFWHVKKGEEESAFLQMHLDQIAELGKEKDVIYKMNMIGLMCFIWQRVWLQSLKMKGDRQDESDDVRAQKNMVSYIYENYTEKITLNEIAQAGNICRSKCCSIFKKYLQQSPIDFLNTYRLEVSRNLLRSTDKSITEIAVQCGFNHLSYYSKMFLQVYGCTPRQYRAQ